MPDFENRPSRCFPGNSRKREKLCRNPALDPLLKRHYNAREMTGDISIQVLSQLYPAKSWLWHTCRRLKHQKGTRGLELVVDPSHYGGLITITKKNPAEPTEWQAAGAELKTDHLGKVISATFTVRNPGNVAGVISFLQQANLA